MGELNKYILEPTFRILQTHVFVAMLKSTYSDVTEAFDDEGLEITLRSALLASLEIWEPGEIYEDRLFEGARFVAHLVASTGFEPLRRHGHVRPDEIRITAMVPDLLRCRTTALGIYIGDRHLCAFLGKSLRRCTSKAG